MQILDHYLLVTYVVCLSWCVRLLTTLMTPLHDARDTSTPPPLALHLVQYCLLSLFCCNIHMRYCLCSFVEYVERRMGGLLHCHAFGLYHRVETLQFQNKVQAQAPGIQSVFALRQACGPVSNNCAAGLCYMIDILPIIMLGFLQELLIPLDLSKSDPLSPQVVISIDPDSAK